MKHAKKPKKDTKRTAKNTTKVTRPWQPGDLLWDSDQQPEPVYVLKDIGPYPVWSTALLSTPPAVPAEDGSSKIARITDAMFFCYSIGGNVWGASKSTPATRLETNIRVANQFVDESLALSSVDLIVPRVALPWYQHNPAAGPYVVTEQDIASLAAYGVANFYCGGDKPFVEAPLAHRAAVPVTPDKLRDPDLKSIVAHAGGWIFRLAEFLPEQPLRIRRIEKFWGTLAFPHGFPVFGQHAYNPAVIPVAMVLNGQRARGCA